MPPYSLSALKRKQSPSTSAPSSKRSRTEEPKWTPEDKKLEKNVSAAEFTTRSRSHRYFQCPPEDLLPDGVYIDTSANGATKIKGMELENTNWTPKFANTFNKTLCCVPFHHYPELLTWAIQEAMYLRLEDKSVKISRPSIKEIDKVPHHKFVLKLEDLIVDMGKPRGSHVPSETGRGLLARDLELINKAWDKYVEKSSDTSILKMADYQKEASQIKKRGDLPPTSDLLEERRNRMLNHRALKAAEKLSNEQDDGFEDDSSFDGFSTREPSQEPSPTQITIDLNMDEWPAESLPSPIEPGQHTPPFYVEHRRVTSRADLALYLDDTTDYNFDEELYVNGAPPIGKDHWVEIGLVLADDPARWA